SASYSAKSYVQRRFDHGRTPPRSTPYDPPDRKQKEHFMSRIQSRSLGAAAGLAVAMAAALPAHAQTVMSTPVPGNLQVPAGHTAYLKASAEGTQNYVCLPSGGSLAWKFQSPQATLTVTVRIFNHDVRQQIATHFLSPNPMEAGLGRPTWQSSLDTSAVWAKK